MAPSQKSQANPKPLALASVIRTHPFSESDADRFAANAALAHHAPPELLSTKLVIPQVRSNLVDRPHLFAKLDSIGKFKLVAVTAPAGFGKTTMLSAWASGFSRRMPVSWLSLDRGDNLPSTFWRYLVTAAEQALGVSFLSKESLDGQPFETLIPSLMNRINEYGEHFVLVLDDLHLIDNPAVHGGLSSLAERMPGFMHIIFASRTVPPIPLARMRAGEQLLEIGPEDLRFSDDEVGRFMEETMGLKLAPSDLTTLAKRTEGWAAGLQLAALSLKGSENIGPIIESFTGSDRYILDYLMDEVLRLQPDGIRRFLTETSVLPRLSASFCDYVLKAQDSWAVLEDLEKANLFIVSLDRERCWYRYHHLFLDFLRDRLRKEHPERIPDLQRLASLWLAENGFDDDAIDFALEAKDYGRGMELMAKVNTKAFERGDESKLLQWLERIPRDILREDPGLSLTYAYLLVYFYRIDQAQPWLEIVERFLESPEPDPAAAHGDQTFNRQDLQAELNLTRTMKASMEGDVEKTSAFAEASLDILPRTRGVNKIRARWMTEFCLGYVHWERRNLDEAVAHFERAVAVCQSSERELYAVPLTLGFLARVQMLQGRLHALAKTCRTLLRLSEGKSGAYLYANYRGNYFLGCIYYEWDQLEEAAGYLTRAAALADSLDNRHLTLPAWTAVHRLARAKGEPTLLAEAAAKLNAIFGPDEPAERSVRLEQAQMFLGEGRLEPLSQWLTEIARDEDYPVEFPWERERLTVAKAYRALKQPDEAAAVLESLRTAVRENGLHEVLIETLILESLLYSEDDESPSAVFAPLGEALERASAEGYRRIFIDYGQPVRDLLSGLAGWIANEEAAMTPKAREHLEHLLDRFERSDAPVFAKIPSQTGLASADLLSERETEILRHIADGLSNQEIAKLLYIADGTVKKHLSNIFEKLNVHNRTKAIAIARESGIL